MSKDILQREVTDAGLKPGFNYEFLSTRGANSDLRQTIAP